MTRAQPTLSGPAGLLDFPGKIAADPTGNRLFISDSSHNRIIVADLNTDKVLDVIGSSKTGLDNGAFETARIHRRS